jgi:hypothetical protein
MTANHISLGMIPKTPQAEKPKPPPAPTIANFLDGLGIFWSQLDAGNGSITAGNSLITLPNYDIGKYFNESTMRALQKKGWSRHPLGGTMWGGTF